MAATTAKTGLATTIGAVVGTLISVVAIGDRFYAPTPVVAAQSERIATHAANQRFRANGERIIRTEVGWWRFLTRQERYKRQAFLDFALSTDASWQGWLSAYESKQAEGPEVQE